MPASSFWVSYRRQGWHDGRPAGGLMHRRWLAGLRFKQAADHLVLEDMIATVEAAKERRDRLTREIEVRLDDGSLAPVVQALHGVALVNAATVVAELGGLPRFASPRQLTAYLGLAPSAHASGDSRRQSGITKAGEAAARRMLIEAAWSDRFPARVSRERLRRQEDLAKPVRKAAWKAKLRLCRRHRRPAHRGKQQPWRPRRSLSRPGPANEATPAQKGEAPLIP